MHRHEKITTKGLPMEFVIHTEHLKNQNILRHWHHALEIDYLVHGKAKFVISGQEIVANSGDLVIINSNEIHSVQPLHSKQDTLALTYLLPYDFLKVELKNYDNEWFTVDQKVSTIVKSDLFNYYQDYLATQKGQELLLKSDIYRIIYDLQHYLATDRSQVLNIPTLPTLHKLSQVVAFIDQNSAEKLTLKQIAQKVNLSEGYLSRTFNKQMGTSVMAYVNLIRLKNAFEMLTNSKKDIETISDLTGFANPKSFRKIFVQVYKMTPGKYRKDLQRSKNDLK